MACLLSRIRLNGNQGRLVGRVEKVGTAWARKSGVKAATVQPAVSADNKPRLGFENYPSFLFNREECR